MLVICRRVVEKLARLGKARAVAWAVPRMLRLVVFEGAAEVWTSWCGGRHKSDGRLKSVYSKLWVEDCARGIENGGIRIGFSSDKVAENVGGDHGICHAPFVKSRCDKHVGRGF